jgi:hypothetical protein
MHLLSPIRATCPAYIILFDPNIKTLSESERYWTEN